MSKGSARRPCLVSREVEDLRWGLALGKITKAEYNACMRRIKTKEVKRPIIWRGNL